MPAGVTHRFEEFTDDLAVWVFFYGPEGGEAPDDGGPGRGAAASSGRWTVDTTSRSEIFALEKEQIFCARVVLRGARGRAARYR